MYQFETVNSVDWDPHRQRQVHPASNPVHFVQSPNPDLPFAHLKLQRRLVRLASDPGVASPRLCPATHDLQTAHRPAPPRILRPRAAGEELLASSWLSTDVVDLAAPGRSPT